MVLGYAVMGYMIYLIIVTQRITPKIWDPYTILGISRVCSKAPSQMTSMLTDIAQSASEKAIKKQYKKLSLTLHPDKVNIDAAKNQTIEGATALWVEVSKAYKALTDEDIRNNYLQYGHPDGKQSFSIGIALPKMIIEEGAGKYVLLLYGALLGVLLPYVVGRWWYGTQRVTKEKVYVNTAASLFQQYQNDLTKGGVVCALTAGEEYKDIFKGNKAEQGLNKVESKIMAEGEATGTVAGLAKRDVQKINSFEGVQRKTCALLWAYLGRVKLEDPSLDDGKTSILITSPCLLICYRKVRSRSHRSRPQRRLHRHLPRLLQRQSPIEVLLHLPAPNPSNTTRLSTPPTTPPHDPPACLAHRRRFQEPYEPSNLHVLSRIHATQPLHLQRSRLTDSRPIQHRHVRRTPASLRPDITSLLQVPRRKAHRHLVPRPACGQSPRHPTRHTEHPHRLPQRPGGSGPGRVRHGRHAGPQAPAARQVARRAEDRHHGDRPRRGAASGARPLFRKGPFSPLALVPQREQARARRRAALDLQHLRPRDFRRRRQAHVQHADVQATVSGAAAGGQLHLYHALRLR